MTVEAKRHSELPVVHLTMKQPIQMPDDVIFNATEGAKLKHDLGGHVYRIVDVRDLNLDFSNMMMGMSGDQGMEGSLTDPDVTTLFLGDGDLVEFGVKALAEQDQYGKLNVKLFASEADVYTFIRDDMKNR